MEKRKTPQSILNDTSRDILGGVAITCFIFGISVYIPVFGFFCAMLLPLPMLFYRSKLGRTNSAIVLAVSFVVMGFLSGGFALDMFFFLALLALGFVLGEFIEMGLSIDKIVLYTSASVLSAVVVCIFLYSSAAHIGIMTLISDYVGRNLDLSIKLYKEMGVSRENMDIIRNSLENIQYVLVRIIPSMVGALILLITWANILIGRPLLRQNHLFCPDFGELNKWKSPEHLVWAAIACGVVVLLPEKNLKILAINGLILLMTIYFFQGIAIVSFYFNKKQFPKMLRIFIYTIIAIQQLMLLLIVGLGFFDTWMNFRKLPLGNAGDDSAPKPPE